MSPRRRRYPATRPFADFTCVPTPHRSDDDRFHLRYRHEDDLLRVWVEGGDFTQQTRVAYWNAIVAEARRIGCRRLLVLDRKKGRTASPIELTQMAVHFRAEAAHFDAIAVVEPDADFVATLEHGEIVARAVGISLRVFDDARNAERWVRYGWKRDE